MISRRIFMTFIFIVYFLFLGLWGNGCKSGNDPVTPSNSPNESLLSLIPDSSEIGDLPIAITGSLADGGSTGVGVLGVYDVVIDPVHLTGEVVSKRDASKIGDSYVVDISNFLSVTPCTNCLKIVSINLNASGNLVIKFALKHPFEHGTFSEPPSATNRLDLHIFDVTGILRFVGIGTIFPLMTKALSPATLVNADGYTGQFDGYLDASFFTLSNLHPYRIMSYDPTEGNFIPTTPYGFDPINAPTGHNVLKMGGQTRTDFELALSSSDPIYFMMLISAAYGQSAIKDTRLEPIYYMPEFNRKEAWKVKVQVTANTLFHTNPSTYCDLAIDVWDWNHSAIINAEMPFKNNIRSSSTVKSVQVEIPGVSSFLVPATGPSSGDGVTLPLRYNARVTNSSMATSGIYHGVVKVTDSRELNQNTGGIGDGVARDGVTFLDFDEFATYQIFEVEVFRPEPVAIIETIPDPPIINPSESITFDGSSSYDYDGSIVLYEWDFDYIGTTFTIDAVGATPPPQTYDNNTFSNKAVRVALRVTDDNAPAYKIVAVKEITVHPNRSPIADFTFDPPYIKRGEIISFDASISSDPDNDTLTYQWDWDYQSGTFTIDDTGVTSSHQFDESGCFNVALRVYDEGIPSPAYNIKTKKITVLPVFSSSMLLDNTMTARSFPHANFSCATAVDPNTDDIYIAYQGTTTANYMRCQRSNDGGQTWGAPHIINLSTNQSGTRGIALALVPDSIPGTIYAFWISDGGNSTSQQSDGWNIKCIRGYPEPSSNNITWGDPRFHQDITLYSLSINGANKYNSSYYVYSQPTDLSVAVDPIAIGHVYVAYAETGYNETYAGESVRLIKTTSINEYPEAQWTPLTITSHVASATGNITDYDGIDIAIDRTRNVYVVWDDNVNFQIKLRKYPYGQAPGNPAQVVCSSTAYAHLSYPRIAISKDNNPVIVYRHTYFTGGVNGISEIILNYGTGDLPDISLPMRVNSYATRNYNHIDPDIGIEKNCGTIFVVYEDRRDNTSNGEMYWTILDSDYNIIQEDQRINDCDPTYLVADKDVHIAVSDGGDTLDVVAVWEKFEEDTYAVRAN